MKKYAGNRGEGAASGGAITEAGRTQIFEIDITSAANADVEVIATITDQPVLIKTIVLSANSKITTDLTSASIAGGAAYAVEFISAALGVLASIGEQNEQVASTAPARFQAGAEISINLDGTGATAVDLTATIEFESCVDGGYLV